MVKKLKYEIFFRFFTVTILPLSKIKVKQNVKLFSDFFDFLWFFFLKAF